MARGQTEDTLVSGTVTMAPAIYTVLLSLELLIPVRKILKTHSLDNYEGQINIPYNVCGFVEQLWFLIGCFPLLF